VIGDTMLLSDEVAHYGFEFARPLRLLEGPDGALLRPSHGFGKAPSADIRRGPFSCPPNPDAPIAAEGRVEPCVFSVLWSPESIRLS
jgi:hypothetical protein